MLYNFVTHGHLSNEFVYAIFDHAHNFAYMHKLVKKSIVHVDEPGSSVVSASWEDEDTMTATIQTADDVFTIEVSASDIC